MAVVRVLLVDDQAAFLRAMKSVVHETPGLGDELLTGRACGQAGRPTPGVPLMTNCS